jgi:DNA-directed RNA polymerase specialized sigma24 family protein
MNRKNGLPRVSLTSQPGNYELSEQQLQLAEKFTETLDSEQSKKIFLMGCRGFKLTEITKELKIKEGAIRIIAHRIRKKFINWAQRHNVIADNNIFTQAIDGIYREKYKKTKGSATKTTEA